MNILLVGAGGFIGAVARYGIVVGADKLISPSFPWGVLTANIFGSLLIGVLAGIADGRHVFSNEARLFLFIGALGGFIHKFGEFPMDEWDTMTSVNLRAPFALTQACLPLLREAADPESHAAVINIASVDGVRVAGDNDWAYGTSKAGLIHLTRQLAGLLGNKHGREGGHNITFNAIAPGPFPGMLDRFLETEEGRAAVGAVTVSGRVGKPEDIGAACIYLASRAGSYVTGAMLPVDGGLLVGKRANA